MKQCMTEIIENRRN